MGEVVRELYMSACLRIFR